MTALLAETVGPGSRGVRPAWLAWLWLAAFGALLALAASQDQRDWSRPAPVEVVLGGEYYRLDAPQLEWLRAFSALHLSEGRVAARGLLEAELGAGLDEVFAPVYRRLPEFADWYYSLGGEYSRLGMAALAQLNLADGNFLASKAASMLFPTDEWEAALAGLDRRMLATLQAQQQVVRADWLQQVGDRLAPYRVPAPLATSVERSRAEPLRLDGFMARWLAEEQAVLAGRVRMSSVAGGATAGTVLWRRAAARAATATGRAVAVRGASRTAARAGAATTSGLAVCAATGPAAAGCALLAGAAAWVATDWALLRLDEWRNRDDLLAALEAGLEQLQMQMRDEVLAAHDALNAELEARAGAAIEREFRPARAGRQEPAPVPGPGR